VEALDDRFKVQGTGKNTPEGWALRFEELDVWKRSARLSAEIYRGLMELRDFCFRDQITRAGLSVPSNIAEGYERDSDREFLKVLSYAKGSCGELRTQIYIWNGHRLHRPRDWQEMVGGDDRHLRDAGSPHEGSQAVSVSRGVNVADSCLSP
jgi:four helix bundle protein